MKKILSIFVVAAGFFANAQISLGTGTTLGLMPVPTYWDYSYTQQIFTKNEIQAAAAGNITGIKFYLKPTDPISNSSSWKVYIGHTSKATYSSNTDWVPISSMTEVFSGNVVNNNGELTVNFTSPFLYNNIDNLVIAVDENSPGTDSSVGSFYKFTGVANSSIYHTSETVNINPASPPAANNRTTTKSRITFLGLTPANLSVSDAGNLKNDIKVYPNPVKNILNISDVSEVNSVKISDASGRQVKSFVKPSSVLNLSELKAGVYMVDFEMNDGSGKSIKVIKK